MGRQYVPSTPQTRGEEKVPDVAVSEAVGELTLDDLSAAAAAQGYELVPVEPAGNGSLEDWVAYARKVGAEDEDLVDDKGEPLKRDALKAKYATPVEKTEVTGD